jgi:acyl carrier protein
MGVHDPMPATVSETVRQFIVKNFYVADPAALADDTSLLDAGIIDSTGVLEVTAYLEKEFGIQVADTEMLPENLDSISRISAFVARKRG